MGFNQVTRVLTECRITEIIRHGFLGGYSFEVSFDMVNPGYTYLEYQLNTYFIMPYNIIKTRR
jgi:hypothetical protein